jgi:hypothetical protein
MRIFSFEDFFMKFSMLGTSLQIFFKIQGSDLKILDRGLITQKSRDLFAKSLDNPRIRNNFCKENLVDSVHGLLTTAGGARSTVDWW